MEVYLLFSWIDASPLPALSYLAVSSIAGLGCLRLAKAGLREMLSRLRGLEEGREVHQMLQLGKLWFVGALLLFPGYLTDIAALYMALVIRGGGQQERKDSDIVEARARLLDDD